MSRTLIASLAVAALASTAHAQPAVETTSSAAEAPGWRFEIGSEARYLRNPSAAAVTTESLASFVMSAERHLASFELPRGRTLELGVEATWANGSASGTMFQTLDTTLGTNDLLGGVHAAARVWHVFGVSARADVGATRTDLTIAPIGAPQMASVDDHGWGRIATASLGAELEPIATRSVRLGVGLEVGYVATSVVELHASPSNRPDPDRSIETAYESIGRLDLDGWQLRFGAHLSF
jgi:hypothetical protein